MAAEEQKPSFHGQPFSWVYFRTSKYSWKAARFQTLLFVDGASKSWLSCDRCHYPADRRQPLARRPVLHYFGALPASTPLGPGCFVTQKTLPFLLSSTRDLQFCSSSSVHGRVVLGLLRTLRRCDSSVAAAYPS